MAIKTIGASGADFTTIALWSAYVKALGALTENEEGRLIDDAVYARGANTDLDFSSVTLSGFTITLRGFGAGVHDGDFANGARIVTDVSGSNLYIPKNIIIEDFSLNNTNVADSGARVFGASDNAIFRRVIGKTDSTGLNCDVFEVGVDSTMEACRSVGGTRGFSVENTGINANLYSCSAFDSALAFRLPSGHTGDVQNCVSYNSATEWNTTGAIGNYTNNASEDGSHPGTSGVTLTGNPFELDGYTPTSTGELDGVGVNLSISLDAANNPFSNPPSIGAYEVPSTGPSIDSIAGGSTLTDGQASITANYSNFTEEIVAGTVNDGSGNALVLGNVVDNEDGTVAFDMPDKTTISAEQASCPLTTASHDIQLTFNGATEAASISITWNPKSGWEVVESASALTTKGAIYEGFSPAPTDGCQAYYPQGNGDGELINVTAPGIWTSDSATDVDWLFWDIDDGNDKPFTVLIEPDVPTGGEGGMVASMTDSMTSSMVGDMCT